MGNSNEQVTLEQVHEWVVTTLQLFDDDEGVPRNYGETTVVLGNAQLKEGYDPTEGLAWANSALAELQKQLAEFDSTFHDYFGCQ